MRARRRGGLAFALAFSDQGLSALLSLGTTLWLIRRGTAEQLATYVFWANAALVLGTVIGAMTTVHLYRLPPTAGRRGTERAINAAHLSLTLLASLGTFLVVTLLGPPFGLAAATLFVAGSLIGLHARALAASRGTMVHAAAISAAAMLAVGAAIAMEAWRSQSPDLTLLLACNGLAQATVGLWVVWRLCGGLAVADLGLPARRRQLVLARRSGWSLLAGAGNEVFTRLYIFVVPAWFGATALAALAAAQTMLRPATLLAGAFGAASRGPLVARRHAGDTAGFWRILLLGAAFPAAMTFVAGCVVALLWPWISALIFGGRYPGLEAEVLLWTGVLVLGCFWVAGLAGLQALGQLRHLAQAELGGAALCGVMMLPMLVLFGPRGALVAMMIGGLLQVVLLARGIRRGL
ncbi:polysaccharide biosynthesis protein [Falsiroseomonas tokyonensis]|uniref:Polysaccharide biosynthesis protein n=1 Tax=Falsiroseomonas tokyonensis TaxID=430521 RepID=A0ABV7BZQ4_9PROT|nr:hypothetical protein [Falsiroseomonas tokyonensis]MBU8540742.1 hypothetical protein [Falsiroseomonas tokyonensis]